MSPGLGAGGRSRFFGGVSLRPRFFGGVWLRATAVAACCDRVGGISTPLPSFCALRRSAGDGHRCRHRYMYIAGPIRCSDSGPARARKAACGRRAGGAPRLFWYCSRAVATHLCFRLHQSAVQVQLCNCPCISASTLLECVRAWSDLPWSEGLAGARVVASVAAAASVVENRPIWTSARILVLPPDPPPAGPDGALVLLRRAQPRLPQSTLA